jgi:DNA primase
LKKLSSKELKRLSDKIAANIIPIFEKFGIKVNDFDEYISCPCPVHDGDNPNAFTMTTDCSHPYFGMWKCWTQGCEEENVNTPIGLIRVLLSRLQDVEVSFDETIAYSMKLVETDFEDLNKESTVIEFNSFSKFEKALQKREENKESGITRNQVRESLKRPAQYYVKRGYSKEVLDEFDVGVCTDKNKQMRGRVVAPVYDDEFKFMVGCVGRVAHENYNGRKWVNSKKFYAGAWLYGYWLSQDHIRKTRSAILVEGQGDVWRLWEAGIKNVVGMFGSGLTDTQMRILETSGAFTLVLLTDNDEAGNKAKKSIKKKCERIFNIVELDLQTKDVGEMSVEQIENQLKPKLKEYTQ